MIADLKPYADYTDAGPSWLGKVPAHWQIVRSKRLFTARQELARPDDVQLSATQAYGVIAQSLYEERTGYRVVKISVHLDKRRHVERDDFIISMRSFQGGLERAWSTGAIRSSYVVLKPDPQIDAAYFRYLFKSAPYIAALRATGDFIRDGQDTPRAEQAAIGRFVDWAHGRLERTIRAKRKVIALLTEQRRAVIRRAVTRGLDPAVQLKPTGIPWLGEIPKHWELSRVKNEFRCLNTRRTPLNSVERGRMKVRAFDYYGASGVIDKVDDYLFDDELLLIAEDGANLVLRNLPLAIVAKGKFWVNNHAHILKPTRGNIVYMAHVLESLNFRPWISGAAQPKLTQNRLMAILIAVAPPAEQDAIVLHADRLSQPLTATISRLEREIELLREYRTRLVADVVTGKLDVREAAARLPDAAEPETGGEAEDENEEAELTNEAAEA